MTLFTILSDSCKMLLQLMNFINFIYLVICKFRVRIAYTVLDKFQAMVVVNRAVHTTIDTYVVKRVSSISCASCERCTQNDF